MVCLWFYVAPLNCENMKTYNKTIKQDALWRFYHLSFTSRRSNTAAGLVRLLLSWMLSHDYFIYKKRDKMYGTRIVLDLDSMNKIVYRFVLQWTDGVVLVQDYFIIVVLSISWWNWLNRRCSAISGVPGC